MYHTTLPRWAPSLLILAALLLRPLPSSAQDNNDRQDALEQIYPRLIDQQQSYETISPIRDLLTVSVGGLGGFAAVYLLRNDADPTLTSPALLALGAGTLTLFGTGIWGLTLETGSEPANLVRDVGLGTGALLVTIGLLMAGERLAAQEKARDPERYRAPVEPWWSRDQARTLGIIYGRRVLEAGVILGYQLIRDTPTHAEAAGWSQRLSSTEPLEQHELDAMEAYLETLHQSTENRLLRLPTLLSGVALLSSEFYFERSDAVTWASINVLVGAFDVAYWLFAPFADSMYDEYLETLQLSVSPAGVGLGVTF